MICLSVAPLMYVRFVVTLSDRTVLLQIEMLLLCLVDANLRGILSEHG